MTAGLTDAFNHATVKAFAPAEAAPTEKREEFKYIFNGTESHVVGGRPSRRPKAPQLKLRRLKTHAAYPTFPKFWACPASADKKWADHFFAAHNLTTPCLHFSTPLTTSPFRTPLRNGIFIRIIKISLLLPAQS